MTGIRLAGHTSPLERAEYALREGQALLETLHPSQRTGGDDGDARNEELIAEGVNRVGRVELFDADFLRGEGLNTHLHNLRNLENEPYPRIQTINDLGVVQTITRDDHGQLVRRVAAAIPYNEGHFIYVPVDVEVDMPVLALIASCDSRDRVRFLADFVCRTSDAVRLLSCNDRGLRSAVRLLRQAMASYAEEHPADADQSGHDNAGGKPRNLNHAASVPAGNGGVS